MNKKIKKVLPLGLILLVGAILRVWFVTQIPTTQMYDFETYYQLAVNIAQGKGYTLGGYPVAWQGMLYSVGLGILYKILGTTSMLIPKLLNVLMSELTIVFVFMIMTRIYNRNWAKYTAVIFMTFMPQQVTYCNVIGTEVVTAFLLSLTILITLVPMKKSFKLPLLGVMSALLALSKPFFMAYPILLGVQHWLKDKTPKEALLHFAVPFVVMWLVISPWTIRNYQKYDRLIPISYNSGFNMYINNNAQNVNGAWMDYNTIVKPVELQAAIEEEVQSHGASVKTSPQLEVILKPYANQWIKAHPLEFLKLAVIRIRGTYFSGAYDVGAWGYNDVVYDAATSQVDKYTFQRTLNTIRAFSDIMLGIATGFGIVYVFMNIWRVLKAIFVRRIKLKEWVTIPVLNMAFISLVYAVYEGQPRYNFIVLFLLIMAFAMTFDTLRATMQDKGMTQDPK